MLEYKIINIKKLDFECTRRDFEYILYNEFDLDSRYTDNADELEVYIYEDSDKEMLKKALLKYGAEDEYVESLFESKNSSVYGKHMINEDEGENISYNYQYLKSLSPKELADYYRKWLGKSRNINDIIKRFVNDFIDECPPDESFFLMGSNFQVPPETIFIEVTPYQGGYIWRQVICNNKNKSVSVEDWHRMSTDELERALFFGMTRCSGDIYSPIKELRRCTQSEIAEGDMLDYVWEADKDKQNGGYGVFYLKEKETNENMKKRFNSAVNEGANPEDNRLFVRCFNFVTEENWDESDADAKYLFEDGGLDYLMEEVTKESGIVFADKNEFLNYVIENQADLTSDELVAVLVNGAKTNEEATSENVDEGYCYAKLDDLLAEAREEGRKEALNEAKAWYEDYDYVKPAGISDSEWKELGKNALDWKHGERDENIGACGAEKLRKYYAICSAIKFGGGLSAIEAEAEKRGISLNESNSTVFNLDFGTTSVNEGKKPLTKEDIKVKKEDLKTAKAAFAEKAKAIKAIVKAKGLSELLKFGEEFDVEKLTAACNEWFAAEGKELKDKKAEVKGLIKELKKLNVTIAVLSAAIEGFKATKTNESVTSRFASGRNDWKGLKLNEAEEEGSKEGDGDGDGDNKDNAEGKEEGSEGKDKGDEGKDNKEGKEGGEEGSDEETEEIDLPAVVITIKKDALDKCKEDMIAAGVEEDDIEELESDDEESDEVDLKIDTNSILALKDYLKDKGIDLEEKLGIEIQEEDDDEEDSKDDKGKDGKEGKEGEGDEGDDELGGLNDDFFASLGDIGGDEGDNK